MLTLDKVRGNTLGVTLVIAPLSSICSSKLIKAAEIKVEPNPVRCLTLTKIVNDERTLGACKKKCGDYAIFGWL